MSIVLFNYCCTNEHCAAKWKTVQVEKDKSLEDEEEFCATCESETPLKQMGFVAAGGYLKSSVMSQEAKKAMLKKRSHDHFVKSGLKEKRHVMLNGQWKGGGIDSNDYTSTGKRKSGL